MENRLPDWVADILDIQVPATFSDLSKDLRVNTLAEQKAFEHFLGNTVSRKLNDKKFLQKKCFPDLDVDITHSLIQNLTLSRRTTNGMLKYIQAQGGAIKTKELTFHSLSKIPFLGAKSIIEFLYAIEGIKFNFNDLSMSRSNPATPKTEDALNQKIEQLIERSISMEGSDEIFSGDPRFQLLNMNIAISDLMKDNSLRDALSEIDLDFYRRHSVEKYRFLEMLEQTFDTAKELSQQPLDLLLQNLIRTNYKSKSEKNLIALYGRFGLSGQKIMTLEEAGNKANITRERVRQIESGALKKIRSFSNGNTIFLPGFNNVLNILRSCAGLPLPEVEDILISKAILTKRISIRTLINFAQITNRSSTDIEIDRLVDGQEIIKVEGLNVGNVLSQIRKIYSRDGVADLKMACQIIDANEHYQQLTRILNNSDFWLAIDESNRWWAPINQNDIPRNRLINVANKMLSVCNPLGIDDFREGYVRMANFRNSSSASKEIVVPPVDVILNFFKYRNDYSVINNTLSTELILDPKVILGDVEAALVDAISESPNGLSTRSDLMRKGRSLGVNENSLSLYISYSPIFQNISQDIHKIAGVEVSPSALSAMKESVSNKLKNELKTKRVLLSDWHRGLIRIVVRCPEFVNTMVVGAPASIKSHIKDKKFLCIDESNQEDIGTIGVNDQGTIFGMYPFCKSSGIKENDLLVMKFDILEMKVYLAVGNLQDYLEIA